MSIFGAKEDAPVATPNQDPPVVDAVIHVTIADSGIEAYLSIEPPSNGGAAPTLQALSDALASCGVSYHIDMGKLEELVAAPRYNCNVVIASGISPVNGIDGTACFKIETAEKRLKPKENEDGSVDLRDLGIVENVTRGQVLCVITMPTEGTPGISVKGKELLQKKGKPVPSYIGKNTELTEEGTAILAKIEGQVEFTARKISVNETFCVQKNVDNSTGNITVASNLVVRGTVLPGFRIEAGKNIDVSGTVESATIKAGGNVKLKSGITGSELYCEGDLKSRFIENCTIFVKGDINAEYILNSNIVCGKNLKTVGAIAKIIGGRCVVGQNIEANTIGSVANVRTSLELGTDPKIIERQQKLMVQVPNLEKQIQSLKPLIALLRQLEAAKRLTEEKRQLLDTVSCSYDTNIKLLEDLKIELQEIAESIYNKGYGRVICTGTIHPGTKVVMGTANLAVTETLTRTSLYYSGGTICKGSSLH